MLKREYSSKFKIGDVIGYMVKTTDGQRIPTMGVVVGMHLVESVNNSICHIMIKIRRRNITYGGKYDTTHCTIYLNERMLTKVIFKNSNLYTERLI